MYSYILAKVEYNITECTVIYCKKLNKNITECTAIYCKTLNKKYN